MARYSRMAARGARYPNSPVAKGSDPISVVGKAIKNTVKGAGEELAYLGGKVKKALNIGPENYRKAGRYGRGGYIKATPAEVDAGKLKIRKTTATSTASDDTRYPRLTNEMMRSAINKSKNIGVGVGY